ncbi:MAG: PIN domain-containing protein [Verrucomicrobiota bacterium]|jgi:predicted nucleic acid-binding protein
MNSLDTNLLIYAVNRGCEEHVQAKKVYEWMLNAPSDWIISDQILFEFYRGLRHPKILERPLNHREALKQITFLREDSGVLHCTYETSFWDNLIHDKKWKPGKSVHVFDRVLAVTLLKNGVKTFYTRNTKDFKSFEFDQLINPIDG